MCMLAHFNVIYYTTYISSILYIYTLAAPLGRPREGLQVSHKVRVAHVRCPREFAENGQFVVRMRTVHSA